MSRRIDALDKTLMGLLATNGRRSLREAAGAAGVSRPTAAARLRALIEDGVLKIGGLLDPSLTPDLTCALVGLTLDKHRLEEKVQRIADLEEVSWSAVVTGRYDIIAEVVTEDGMSGLYDFLNRSLQTVGGINSSEMFVVMKSARKWTLLPAGLVKGWVGHSTEVGGNS